LYPNDNNDDDYNDDDHYDGDNDDDDDNDRVPPWLQTTALLCILYIYT
jgi:hypothetical protein